MKNNIKVFLKEDVLNQITLQQLLDLSSNLQKSALPLVDGCLKFNDEKLKQLALQASSSITTLSAVIRNLVVNSNKNPRTEESKPLESPTSDVSKMIESATEKFMESLKPLFESLAKKDYDKDGKLETSTEEWKGSRDNSIKQNLEEEAEVEKTEKESDETKQTSIDVTEPVKNVVKILNNEQFLIFKSDFLDALKNANIQNEDFSELIIELEATKNIDSFNEVLEKIYEFADENDYILEINEQ